ncbi:MAG: SNF2-related protein [Clostridia bacterium]|nr:SNF2-related protein [Clostridia bacterium]
MNMAQAREAIHNSAYFARGRAYVDEGRVNDMIREEDGPTLRYTARVRGHGHSYRVFFEYDQATEEFGERYCSCPAFERAQDGCKHVAALMIVACRREKPNDGEPVRIRSFYDRYIETEEDRREKFVNQLLDVPRARSAPQEKVRLLPMLCIAADTAALELRVARRRPYVVRNLREFALRVQQKAWFSYGKELQFAHEEDVFAPEDRALLWHVVMLADRSPIATGAQLALSGAALDRTMRLLMGRTIDLKGMDGSSRVRVEEGEAPLQIGLQGAHKRTRLAVGSPAFVQGYAGAYFTMPEEGKIVCVFGEAFEQIEGLLKVAKSYPKGLELDERQLDRVCARVLAPAKGRFSVHKGEKILKAHTPMTCAAKYRVDAQGDNRLLCRVEYDYDGRTVLPGESVPAIRRDEDAESEAIRAACSLFPERVSEGEYAFEGDDEACFQLITERLLELSQWGEVLIAESLAKMNASARRPMSFGISASGGALVVVGDLGGLSQQELREAYTAHRLRRKYIRLADGTFLSGEALGQAAQAAQVLESLDLTAEQAQKGAQVPESRALYIENALEGRQEIALHAPRELLDWTNRLRQAQKTRVEAPLGLRCTLRAYQETGLSWLCALGEAGFGGILADDMGLGKTVQVLAMLLRAKESGEAVRALVVCPASLQLNWLSEAERFAPDLGCAALLGNAAAREKAIASAPELLIASYDQVRRDAARYEGIEFTHVLLDEAQNIKNAVSLGAKAVKTLRARHRFAMTGTPVENRLSELWSIFDFLMPGYLHSYKKFKERFEAPIVRDADEEARANLRMMVAPFILRRMKKDVLGDLPEKVETIMTSELTPAQHKAYAAYAAQLIDETAGGLADAKDRMRMLAGLTRLRQLCCDPRLCLEGYTGGSGKLEQCMELVREGITAGHRILIFSQFTSMLELLNQALCEEGITPLYLTGETEKTERKRLADAFNAGEGDVFLISLKAGGTGLNLTGADMVIHYDPWWNTSAQNQATDRAYRIGQTRGVQVFSLIAANTVEERILSLQRAKTALSDGVLEGGENLFTLDAQALKALLKG